ncbi:MULTISPECIES: type I secretion system permease/ATPase [unclassified Acinetobacter]|uniref:type I secretion system permease/ATPase n=1 Tax=unclassified Acinetobacter TaxID=196816 RepID=UPI00293505D3|nr:MULTISPECIES: type I secretion system permease/ATPase [unclassified Acinetobacter]WOE32107.1 type I secretion system permease/ATPase [Acinetobacter sp. SAAs470]WOE37576.1 type I secretion system permease/ATPase [Acinetobacter sp. SAAs474]
MATNKLFDPLVACLIRVAKDNQIHLTQDGILSGLPLPNGRLIPAYFNRAAENAGLSSNLVVQSLNQVNVFLLPAILLLKNNSACILYKLDFSKQMATVCFPEVSDTVTEIELSQLAEQYLGTVIYLKQRQLVIDSNIKTQKTNKHWFWDVIHQHRTIYKDILLAAFMINIFALCLPLFIMNVYDRVVPNHAIDTLWVLVIGIMIIISAEVLLKLVRSYFVDLAANRADTKLSAFIMERVLGKRLETNTQSIGAMASSIQSYESIRSFTSSMTLISVIDLPFFVVFLIVIGFINWVFLIPLIIAAVAIVLYALSTHIRLKTLSESMTEASQQRQAFLVEMLNSQETIKSFNAATRMQSVWERTSGFVIHYSSKLRFSGGSVGQVAAWIQQTAGVLIILIGVYQIVNGNLSQGALIACYMLSKRALAPISQLANLLTQYYQASSSLQQLNQVVDAEQERDITKGWVSHPNLQGHIEFKNVSLKYPNETKDALNNVSFSIKAGEKVAILGKIGSGKSTIEKVLLSLYRPTEGAVYIDQSNLAQIDPNELRSQVGYIPQDIQLLNGTLLSNITLANPHINRAGLEQSLMISGLNRILKDQEDGLSMQVGEGGRKLSGGQRQAVAIARAIAQQAHILIFDEPTSAMDVNMENHVIKSLKNYMTPHHTLLLVTHKPELLQLVDRIIILDSGRIVADGPKQQVLDTFFSKKQTVEVAS